jgi:hypothetical protein
MTSKLLALATTPILGQTPSKLIGIVAKNFWQEKVNRQC